MIHTIEDKDLIVDGKLVRWITGYDKLYAIRFDGEVISYKTPRVKIIKSSLNERGYRKIRLVNIDGKEKTHKLHRLVAGEFHFCENQDTLTVDHIDMNKENNHASNLRWCTTKENIHHAMHKKHDNGWRAQVRTKLTSEQKELRKAEVDAYKEEKKRHMKYGSVAAMKMAISKPIVVNGIKYESCNEAAEYITAEELVLCNIRRSTTISRELRNLANGRRKPWKMYGRYNIERVAV